MTTTVIKDWRARLTSHVPILPLVLFRIAFGLLMCLSQVRFLAKGWVKDCFITPEFHFTYRHFEWVVPFGPGLMYSVVIVSALFALFIAIGFFYRFSIFLFFISFTYLELIEKSWYLNHYYLVSLLAFLLLWLPAHRFWSVDSRLHPNMRLVKVPYWTILILRIQVALVYFFGGIAKLKGDWLLNAQPLKIWLLARADTPIIGNLFSYESTAYLFSWGGAIYDLAIPFLLWNARSRPWAYILVVFFHLMTYVLFNIGMFPWIMMAASLVFLSAGEWESLFRRIGWRLSLPVVETRPYRTRPVVLPLLLLFVVFQVTIALRHLVLGKNVLWTENGIRFAWHVMVMEKNGYAEFTVVDRDMGQKFTVFPSEYLTPIQEKQMSFQPDMIWQFAKYLEDIYKAKGHKHLSVYVISKVSLNGRSSKTFIDPATDLLALSGPDAVYHHIMDPE